MFTNPEKRTSFEFQEEDGTFSADILKIDSRFVSLLKWLERIISMSDFRDRTERRGMLFIRSVRSVSAVVQSFSAEDGFLQFMIERLLASNAPAEEQVDEELEEMGDDMKLTSLQSITDFMNCVGRTLRTISDLRRNLAVARSHEVSPEGADMPVHSIMMNIQWKNNYFEAIDPKEARRILDGGTFMVWSG